MIAAIVGGLALAILVVAVRALVAILRSVWAPRDRDDYVTAGWRDEQLRGRRHE